MTTRSFLSTAKQFAMDRVDTTVNLGDIEEMDAAQSNR